MTRTALAFVGYLGLAVFVTWPLGLHLHTHLTGLPGGDGGVYIWNQWVFRHELVGHGRWPLWTDTVLPLAGGANLGLHNYTIFADLLALPLRPWLGTVATFNLVYLINVALAGLGMFVLARRFTGRVTESFVAGAMFATCPFLVARGLSHFSLAAAAPLPFFLYWFDRAWHSGSARDAIAAGVMVAWAASSDPYYGVYCLMIAAVYVLDQLLVLARRPPVRVRSRIHTALDVGIGAGVALVVVVHVLAGGTLRLGFVSVAMRSLYTPMLVLTVLVLMRLLWPLPRISWMPLPHGVVRSAALLGCTAALFLAPEIYALARMAAEGGLVRAPVPWRSSAPGVDLASFFLLNPHHPLAPQGLVDWLARQPGGFDENVMSLSCVGLAVILAAWHLAGYRASRLSVILTLGFAALAVGPFLSVAGVATYIPTPWTILRYVPVIGEARMPQRFGIVVFLGFTLVFTGALVALGTRAPHRRRLLLAVVSLALTLELSPVPRTLYSAAMPEVYQTIAADPRAVRVLDLPFGLRDGLSSLGNFSAASLFYQTTHEKGLLGGYLSRLEERTKEVYRSDSFTAVLIEFSEGRTPDEDALRRAAASAGAFLDETKIGYVVIDVRTPPAFQQFAISALRLTHVSGDSGLELYKVGG